jgi:hypothetical protein
LKQEEEKLRAEANLMLEGYLALEGILNRLEFEQTVREVCAETKQ